MTTILVVEDLGENRYLLCAVLRANGYEVLCAADGAEALRIAQGSPPDVVVTDIMMPVMDGFELCRRWKEDGRLKRIPLVIYTATFTDPKDERLSKSLGADRFLIKPQTTQALLQVLREVLDETGRDRALASATLRPSGDEVERLQQHNEALARKLEKKVRDLEAESARRTATESLLRIAGRMARLGGWSADLATMRVSWSDEVAAIHDMPAGGSPTLEECLGFYAPECRSRMQAVFESCVREGTPYDEEMQLLTASGRRIWVRTIGEAIRGPSGTIAKVQGALQDVTDRKQAELEGEKLRTNLLQSQRIESIGRLAGGVAHDFNNLLLVVLSYADFALQTLREGDPLRADLEEIKNAAERAAALTKQLLAFSRKQLLQPEVVSLNDVVSGVEDLLRRLLGEDIEVKVNLDDSLGNVVADSGQLEQVLVNLAANARDAMPGGGVLVIETANIELDEESAGQDVGAKPGPSVMLSVSDTGTGMDAATKEHLFEPFFTTKQVGQGTGLGLSTVYGIVKQSGGSIWVKSEPGKGSTFKICLPRIDAKVAKTKRPSTPVMGIGYETVLLVEDEDAVRRIAERVLRSAGYRVLPAAGGDDALRLCGNHRGPVDLLLTDIVMPRMSGRELSARVAELHPKIKVLYMSGYTDEAILRVSALAPGTRMIAKPFTAAELTRKVREALDASGNDRG